MTTHRPVPRAEVEVPAPEGHADSRASGLGKAMAAADLVCDELVIEVELLDRDYGDSDAPTAPVRRLLLRSVPEVCGLLGPYLHRLPSGDALHVLDHFFSRAPYSDQRMRRWTPRLRAHLDAYVASLTRWEGWQARTMAIDGDDGDVTVRWVTAWERPDDGAVAADFVGYVNDPQDLARPNRQFAAFARDAEAAYQQLSDEFGVARFKGLRLWIAGADGLPVVRWRTFHIGLDGTEDRG